MRMQALGSIGYEPHGAGPGSVAELIAGLVSSVLVALGLREREPPRIY